MASGIIAATSDAERAMHPVHPHTPRRRHHGRRPGRPDAGAAAAPAPPALRHPGARAPHAPGAAATHKVGESTVEIGAHYFAHVLGLKRPPDERAAEEVRLPLLLQRRPARHRRVTEIGASRALPTGSWQIDRGCSRTSWARRCSAAASLHRRCAMSGLRLAASWARPARTTMLSGSGWASRMQQPARWVVDACGRAGLLKRAAGAGAWTTTTRRIRCGSA
jgi:hypothetical protein